MQYSVWNNGTRRYDYYSTTERGSIHADSPDAGGTNQLGATPEQAAWPLPADARPAGSGEMPKGRIASKGASRGFRINFAESFKYGIVGYLLWRIIR
jgi:hypothetical protein